MDSIQEETEQNEQPPQAVREEATRARRRLAISSIRTKTTLLTVCAIIAAMAVATLLGATAIRNIGTNDSRQMLLLLCEAGEKNLDYYFESVEQSVEMVAAYVEEDLNTVDREQLPDHLARVKGIFARMAHETNGVLTYYYRIDPEYSEEIKGFWFVNVGGQDFREHAVTDITRYDTEDTSALVWFTMPKSSGKPIWLPPYITDNLGARVISYNVPVYQNGQFVGVVGIEIDYSTMAEQVNSITLYDNGYAFINDDSGALIYHPRMDIATLPAQPAVPEGLLGEDTFVHYVFNGVEKQGVWLSLINGMRLNVAVPVSEINAGWLRWINQIILASIALLAVFVLVTMRFTGHITRPLRELTAMAEQVNAGDYDCTLDYKGRDEVGVLTSAFNRLISHLKTYISDLNDLAYADALTSAKNKGAFEIYTQKLQTQVQSAEEQPEFAVCIFDCNNLKLINDQFGHDKGDIYLNNGCAMIFAAFSHSPVFRIGGDEFAAILQNSDFRDRKSLLRTFDDACAARQGQAETLWDRVDIARGIAVYDPQTDKYVSDVVRRADKQMYQNKWKSKLAAGGTVR